MNSIKMKIASILGYNRYDYNESYNNGHTDVENGDAILKVIKSNEKAGVFGKIFIDNKAEVIRNYDYITVSKPGFYIYKHLRRKTKQKFSVILFLSTGRYTSYDIYRKVDSYGEIFAERGLFGEHELLQGDGIELSSLKSCIPVCCKTRRNGIRSPEALLEHEFGKKLFENLLANIQGISIEEESPVEEEIEEEISIEIEQELFDGSIALLFGYNDVLAFNSDGTLSKYIIPNVNQEQNVFYNTAVYSFRYQGIRLYRPHWSSRGDYQPVELLFYNPNTEEFIWEDKIQDQFAAFAHKNRESLLSSYDELCSSNQINDDQALRDSVNFFTTLKGPTQFKNDFQNYLVEKGLNVKITDVWPSTIIGCWTKVNWTTKRSETFTTIDPCYYVQIEYNKKQIIGPTSRNTFTYLAVREEEDHIRLVHSSRCQHITAWSKNTTDQGYAHWEIYDWLSGPFAEEAKVKFKEVPVVFMGNKFKNSKTRKEQALQRLRERMGL